MTQSTFSTNTVLSGGKVWDRDEDDQKMWRRELAVTFYEKCLCWEIWSNETPIWLFKTSLAYWRWKGPLEMYQYWVQRYRLGRIRINWYEPSVAQSPEEVRWHFSPWCCHGLMLLCKSVVKSVCQVPDLYIVPPKLIFNFLKLRVSFKKMNNVHMFVGSLRLESELYICIASQTYALGNRIMTAPLSYNLQQLSD